MTTARPQGDGGAREETNPTLTRAASSFGGRVLRRPKPIIKGIGKVQLDDSQWRVSGPDTPAGSRVRVIEADGTTLKVERAD